VAAASTGSSSGSSKGGDKGGGKADAGGQGSSSTASTGSSADKAAKNEPKPAGGAGQGPAGRTGQHRPRLARIGRIGLGTAGRIAADAGANLAKGTADVAKAKAASLREAAAERIADTTGGKIAAAIKAQGSGTAENIDVPDQQPAPSFGDNSLAGGPADADPESEVAAFANREQGRDGTTA
jgi:type IV secretion system protein VirB6/type IV secretion system protein TrbL